ncbi:helix-turn-helix domain-containing protein [Candidatus Micrarchaeota archaeon]|nr:helix-turn-helix domain-containing protein [Candidatus Micrarchaeota archaeon]
MVIEVVDIEAAVHLCETSVAVDYNDRMFVDEVAPRKRGRPRKVQENEQLTQVLRLYFVEKLSMRKVAEVMGVSHMSVYRMLSDPNVELLL